MKKHLKFKIDSVPYNARSFEVHRMLIQSSPGQLLCYYLILEPEELYTVNANLFSQMAQVNELFAGIAELPPLNL